MTIIQSQKIEEKVTSVEQMMADLDAVDNALAEKAEEIELKKKRDAELDSVLIPLRDKVSAKELELEKLKNKDFSLNTSLSAEGAKLQKEKEGFALEQSNARASIAAAQKEIADQMSDLTAKKESADRQTKANEEKTQLLSDREKQLDLLANNLEEYKQRIIKVGLKRNGGQPVDGIPQ